MNTTKKEIFYPVGIQSFSKIRERGFLYVDKTAYIHELVKRGGYYFLSRPRRFGKSLLLSTIEAYYKGQRELFKGLALDSLAENWDSHPILHLDLNVNKYDSIDSLDNYLDHILQKWEEEFDISNVASSLSQRFGDIIQSAYKKTGKKVVILIDEYDKPILNAINDRQLSEYFRDTLKAFYGNLKSMDTFIEFGMLTGVARFSKVSIFSDLNNLRDISFEQKFSAICGITNEELHKYFRNGIEELVENMGSSYDQISNQIKQYYDGYHFSGNLVDIYNPFSLVNLFASGEFSDYWFETGTPSYIVKLLRNGGWNLQDLENYKIEKTLLRNEGILSGEIIPTLFQAGYLTIKDYDPDFEQYQLGYPNSEVERSFIKFLIPYYLSSASRRTEFDVRNFVMDVRRGKPESFMQRVDSMLRGIPHLGKEDSHEHTFQNAIYLIFKLVGFYTEMEEHTSNGRIDMTVITSDYIYLFEFKVDKSAEVAMQQIYLKEYWKKFAASEKTIYLIGANFNTKKKCIDDIQIETISK